MPTIFHSTNETLVDFQTADRNNLFIWYLYVILVPDFQILDVVHKLPSDMQFYIFVKPAEVPLNISLHDAILTFSTYDRVKFIRIKKVLLCHDDRRPPRSEVVVDLRVD